MRVAKYRDYFKGFYQLAYSDELNQIPFTRKLLGQTFLMSRDDNKKITVKQLENENFKELKCVNEINGIVYLDYRNSGESLNIPNIFPNSENKSWLKPKQWVLPYKADYRDVIENAVDIAHFCKVHKFDKSFQTQAQFFENGHLHIRYSGCFRVFGFSDFITIDINYYSSGLSCVNMYGKFLEARIQSCPTPVDFHNICHFFSISLRKGFVRNFLAPVYFFLIKNSFQDDINIWQYKNYIPRPIICKGEENILKFRRWLLQFE